MPIVPYIGQDYEKMVPVIYTWHTMRLSNVVDHHPKRNEIIQKLLDNKFSSREIAEEYGVNRNTLNKVRKLLTATAGAIVASSIPPPPELASRTTQKDLSFPALADDLQYLKDKLRTLQTNPALKPSQIMSAVEGERKVIESLLRMAELMHSHGDSVKAMKRLAMMERALASTFRLLPEAGRLFKQEYNRLKGFSDDDIIEEEGGTL